jgi:hypothetical protein
LDRNYVGYKRNDPGENPLQVITGDGGGDLNSELQVIEKKVSTVSSS